MNSEPSGRVSLTRRDFLRALGGAAVGLAAYGTPAFADLLGGGGPFDILVVGDSLIWGQGLRDEHKIHTLVAEWLRRDVFQGGRNIDIKVKAHSGATLKFHPDEAEKYKKIGRDETYPYAPELSFSTPSSWKQLEVAANEYRSAGKAEGADLILISGGATDISVAGILDPSGDDAKLRTDIERYCRRDMLDVLRLAAQANPNALISVVGYFPLITPHTNSHRLLNAWLELRGFPRLFKPLVNNPLSRAISFKKVRRHAQRRSVIWAEESTRNLRTAVDDLNKEFGRTRAFFVPTPIGDDQAFETQNSLLFRMRHNHPDDPLLAERRAQCRVEVPKLRKEAGIAAPLRYCEDAAIGHPTSAGSRAYFEAVKSTLTPLLRSVPG